MKKNKIYFVLLFWATQFCFSQNEKPIHGKILSDDFPVQGIKVFNINTEKSTVTNNNGDFTIAVIDKQSLTFSGLGYVFLKKNITPKDVYDDNLIIIIQKKAIELKEVVVPKTLKAPVAINTQIYVDQKYFDDAQSSPINRNVYTGVTENGTDFVRLFKDVVKLFKKKKSKNNNEPKVEFKEYVSSNCNKDFFVKTLNIKPSELELFLEFCDKDPNSKKLLEDGNPLLVMDFLKNKNDEFKKLSTK
jgi:hypothetical protein